MTRSELMAVVKATGCVEHAGEFVLLRDPNATEAERAAMRSLQSRIENQESKISEGWLGIRTGGSSGDVKFARHDERTLATAVRGFCSHFGLERVNAVDVLPAYHVSGFMARVRCAATGGEHVAWAWKDLAAGKAPAVRGAGWVISLVPTQLQRLLANAGTMEWLRRFRIIFVGGGPVWPELAETAAKAELRVSLSYGMTETAAMVAALQPEEFLAGGRSCGTALPHARVSVERDGTICVAGESVCHGYVGSPAVDAAPGEACNVLRYNLRDKPGLGAGGEGRRFVTADVGWIDERGHLQVLGRRDAVIITGGKKVQPAEVEAALCASGEFEDVAVLGVPDAEWGEAVVACYLAGGRAPDCAKAASALAPHQRPKRFVAIAAEAWPRNAQGKVNRAELRERLTA